MKINIPYEIGDTLYMKDDRYQDSCTLVEVVILPEKTIKLVLSFLGQTYTVYECEVTKERDILKIYNDDAIE